MPKHRTSSLALALPGVATPISFIPASTMTWSRAEEVFTLLGTIGRASPWWVADAHLWAEKKFGESRAAQLAEKFALEPGTLANIVSVGSRIPVERRKVALSFGHHADVAKFPPAVQTQWLDKAEKHGWTRAELRRQLKGTTVGDGRDASPGAESAWRDRMAQIRTIVDEAREKLDRFPEHDWSRDEVRDLIVRLEGALEG